MRGWNIGMKHNGRPLPTPRFHNLTTITAREVRAARRDGLRDKYGLDGHQSSHSGSKTPAMSRSGPLGVMVAGWLSSGKLGMRNSYRLQLDTDSTR